MTYAIFIPARCNFPHFLYGYRFGILPRKWKSPEILRDGAMVGAIFESYVVSEIIKSYWHNGKRPKIYYYRDKNKQEIDVLLEENGQLYPIEIKSRSNPDRNCIRHFHVIEDVLEVEKGEGAVICMADQWSQIPLTKNDYIVPVGYI